MKKAFIYTALALLAITTSCKKDDLGPAATNLDASSVVATARVGAVHLQWNTPDKANYKYVEVKYNHPGTKKEHTRLASVHADTILIDGLLRSYGEIEYRLTPVTAKGNRGTTVTVSAQCETVPAVKRVVDGSKTEIPLTADKVWTDSSHQSNDADGGGMPALVDGRNDTYWHMAWSGANNTPFPHYLVADLTTPVSGAISFYWRGRHNNGRNNPKKLELWGSNTEFTGQTNVPAGFNLDNHAPTLIGIVSDMPSTQAVEFNSATFILTEPYRYIWVKFTEGYGSTNFSAIAEWKFFKYKVQTYDPETGETTEN